MNCKCKYTIVVKLLCSGKKRSLEKKKERKEKKRNKSMNWEEGQKQVS